MANKKYTDDFFYSRYLVVGFGNLELFVDSNRPRNFVFNRNRNNKILDYRRILVSIYNIPDDKISSRPTTAERKGAVSSQLRKAVNKQIYFAKQDSARENNRKKSSGERKPVDLKNYIENKANRNVMIVGTSGQGKSLLTRYLLELFDNRKVIFSFKPNDEYLKMGYKIVEASKALPNAFRDIEAFVNAFAITFPMTAIGITAQYIPVYLREIGKDSKDWKDFQPKARQSDFKLKEPNTTECAALRKRARKIALQRCYA